MAQQDYLDAMGSLFSSDQEVQDFLDSIHKPLKKTIKVLGYRMPIDTFITQTKQRGWLLTPTQFDIFTDMFYIDREDLTLALGKTFLHLLWFFYMQELAASTSPHFMDITDWLVLDMCASPGGKTVQLADYTLAQKKNTIILANEYNAKRIPALASNLTRTGMYNTIITKYNGAMFGTNYPELFDAILLDAPCSGEGTGFKSDSAFKRRKQSTIEKIARTQEMLLTSAVKACKPWWSIVYSTCTLNPLENEQVIQHILEKYSDILELESIQLPSAERGVTIFRDQEIIDPTIAQECIRCRPHKQGTGWFFVAKLRKKDSILLQNIKRPYDRNSENYFTIGSDVQKQVRQYMEQNFWLTIDTDKYLFVRTPKNVYVTSPIFRQLHGMMAFDRVGISILKWSWPHEWRPEHWFGLVFGTACSKNILSINDSQAQDYVMQKDLPITWEVNGYRVLQRQWYGVWVGKVVDNVLKNKFVKVI
jgi:16S rRNA (cytosine1407-C5)-methyltransferase